jgi:hypothetical protein
MSVAAASAARLTLEPETVVHEESLSD